MKSPKPVTEQVETLHEIAVSRSIDPLDEEPDESEIASLLTSTLRSLDAKASEVSVRIVSRTEIAALNEQYRGQDKATNVLSFPAEVSIDDYAHLGDIVICTTIVKEEACKYNKPFRSRYTHMLVHGLLHLMGYDHLSADDRDCMEALEIDLLSHLGVENPYEEEPLK
jgi:probable rRNA maturation factor